MKKPFTMGLLGLGWAAGCGSSDPSSNSAVGPVGSESSAIQDGTVDTTHEFAVGIVQMTNQAVAFCSGVLLAPNLVATARHCVSQLQSPQIDCSSSVFVSTYPPTDIFVTPDPTITMSGHFVTVASIHVPPATTVCGNDIALLILSKSIQLPQYVTPTISPPMTDHQLYATAVTAIGYGVDTPLDTMGTSAGTRRIKQDVNLVCIPNDTTFPNCLLDPTWLQFATVNEFEGGDGTCDGDSGSGAYDQGSFDKGNWVAFGVLSRGGVSPEGGTCMGSIYTRFDAWGSLLIETANEAAKMGGYTPPSWTGSSACLANATACLQDSDCCSVNCLSHDNVNFACSACDGNNPCNTGFGCQGGVCVAMATSSTEADSGSVTSSPALAQADSGTVAAASPSTSSRSSGCAVAVVGSGGPAPWFGGALGIAVMALVRGRRKAGRA
ncbi:MAG: trypsin-like serine protease [Polyangiaceae bacterium]